MQATLDLIPYMVTRIETHHMTTEQNMKLGEQSGTITHWHVDIIITIIIMDVTYCTIYCVNKCGMQVMTSMLGSL